MGYPPEHLEGTTQSQLRSYNSYYGKFATAALRHLHQAAGP